jgi:hypothetical protein
LNPLLTIDSFLTKWAASGAAERANAQSFVIDLCQLLGVEAPMPKTPDESANAYVFEKTIPGASGSKNFIDCYKRGHFVLEAKQGADAGDDAARFSAAAEQQRAQRKTGHGQRLLKTLAALGLAEALKAGCGSAEALCCRKYRKSVLFCPYPGRQLKQSVFTRRLPTLSSFLRNIRPQIIQLQPLV